MLQQLSEFLYNNDNLSALKCRKEYFNKWNRMDLWELLEQYPLEWDLRQKIQAACILKVLPSDIPKCRICGKPVMVLLSKTNPKFSNYCSKECARKDVERIRNGVKNRNHNKGNEKREKTMMEKYGVGFNLQRENVKVKLHRHKVSESTHIKLNDRDWLRNQYLVLGKTLEEIADEIGCYYGTVSSCLQEYGVEIRKYSNRSREEKQICQFLSDNDIYYEVSDRKVIRPLEIDILIPQFNFGIEMDGLYHHSYSRKEFPLEITRHLDKTLSAKKCNIDLVHFTDLELLKKEEIIKSMILHRIGKSGIRIPGRKCQVGVLSTVEARKFLDQNHMMGYENSSLKLGLCHNQDLVSVLTLGKPRFLKNGDWEWEIIRFSNKLNHSVSGSFSKLLSYFVKNYKPKSIITYADRRFGEGGVYKECGFEYLRSTSPGYFWVSKKYEILSRYMTQKNKLKELGLTKYDDSMTEEEIMFGNGYSRFWDCGNNVYGLKL